MLAIGSYRSDRFARGSIAVRSVFDARPREVSLATTKMPGVR
jgi:hypothetical protein